jgi:protein-glutamine gamma-glutamyltransferase
MTERLVSGIILALIVESAHWLKIRWEFTPSQTERTWHLNAAAILVAAVLIALDTAPAMVMSKLLTWLPALLLPMQFVQSYGFHDSLPLNSFSFLSKQRRERNLRLGLTESPIHFNFGNFYFVTALVASTLGPQSGSMAYLPGVVILTGWMLLAATHSRPLALVISLIVAAGIALTGQFAIQRLDDFLGGSAPRRSGFDPNTTTTMVGRPGRVELSPEIAWRLRPEGSATVPRLLRTATYNSYRSGNWSILPQSDTAFTDLDTRLFRQVPYFLLAQGSSEEIQLQSVADALPRFTLRGAAFAETPLPLPGDAASLRDFEQDGLERNSQGTVRIFPKQSVIEGSVLWESRHSPENPPLTKEDIAVPTREKEALREVLAELKLDQQPSLSAKLTVLHQWFFKNFTYTRNLTIESTQRRDKNSTAPSAIAQFLTTTRAGHCEYFATAATLLLHEAGIPARYSIGYAVIERDLKNGEYLIRGTHGHAWCRVWDESAGRWIDFDTTPPSWQTSAPIQLSTTQRFNDAVKRFREDFFLWRNRPANRLYATLIMGALGLGVLAFIMRRLWKSRTQLHGDSPRPYLYSSAAPIQTPLNALESHAEKTLGTRPPGTPLATWLARLALPSSAALVEAIRLHQRLRFDPQPASAEHHARLSALTEELVKILTALPEQKKPPFAGRLKEK